MKQTKKQFNYGRDDMNPKPLDAGLAERLYKSVKGPCAYPFKWLYPSEKAFWRVVAAEVRKIVKEAKEGK